MTKELIRKYIWLIDTVNQAGSTGITFKDIRSKWERNDLLSGGIQYPKRSFHNHVTAIRELFGIEITCNKNTNSYYIANSRELKDSSGFKGWLLDALSLNNQLEESSQLKDRILLEENPSGRELLPTILEADIQLQALLGRGRSHLQPLSRGTLRPEGVQTPVVPVGQVWRQSAEGICTGQDIGH